MIPRRKVMVKGRIKAEKKNDFHGNGTFAGPSWLMKPTKKMKPSITLMRMRYLINRSLSSSRSKRVAMPIQVAIESQHNDPEDKGDRQRDDKGSEEKCFPRKWNILGP